MEDKEFTVQVTRTYTAIKTFKVKAPDSISAEMKAVEEMSDSDNTGNLHISGDDETVIISGDDSEA